MKMSGVSPDDPVMLRARARIRAMGGPAKANVFCKILLALFGEYDWNGVPTMPVEIMLLPPPFFLFNIYEVSYWSRCVIVPLLIIMDRKPVKWLPRHLTLDELWPEGREHTSLRFPRVPEPFSWRGLFWKSFFIAVDDGLKIWERFSPRPLRKRAVDAAREWLGGRTAGPGGRTRSGGGGPPSRATSPPRPAMPRPWCGCPWRRPAASPPPAGGWPGGGGGAVSGGGRAGRGGGGRSPPKTTASTSTTSP